MIKHATLRLEQVTSEDVSPTYDIFVNIPPDEDPEAHEDRFVGRIAMFGIKQASDPNGAHGGGGQTFALDITDLYHRLSEVDEFDPSELNVTFVPIDPLGSPKVKIGRLSLYFS